MQMRHRMPACAAGKRHLSRFGGARCCSRRLVLPCAASAARRGPGQPVITPNSKHPAFCRPSPNVPLGAQGASTPARISASGLGQVLRRCCLRVFEQRLLGEAAAVAFHALLATFPALAALSSLCGLAIDPTTAAERRQSLASLLPPGSGQMVGQALDRTAAHGGRLGLGIGLAAAAFWSATAASLQLFGALNLAYGEAES